MICNIGLGGGELLLAAHLAHADRRNFEPFVVCAGKGPLSDQLQKLGVPVAFHPVDRGMKVLRFSVPRPDTAFRLAAEYRREGVDLIHSYTLETRNYANAAALLTGLPLVHTCQDTWFGRNFGRLQWAAMNRLSSRILATSNTALNSLHVGSKLDPRRVKLIRAGIDIGRFAPRKDSAAIRAEFGIGPTDPVVGIVSRFCAEKGFDVFFAAAARVVARFPAARFLIVGGAVLQSDDYAERIHQLVRDLALGPRTIMTGFRDDVERLIACMDVLVSASTHESFGLTLAEAGACGRPVVATRSGGPAEIVVDGETGLLVPVGDSAVLADAVISLLADPERASAMGAAGRRRAEACFDIRTMVRKIETLYAELREIPRRQG
jgi:glycosyltransferase involved in cell wall biosynthesis